MPLKMSPDHDRWGSIDQLTTKAGEATEQPPLPPGGIPKQWLPGIIRWPLRLLALPFVWLDLIAQWVARKIVRPPFKVVGHCHQRGNCCYYVLLPEPKGVTSRIFFFWYTQVNRFYLRSSEPVIHEGERMMVMGCRYLRKDGRCGHYRLRPMLCRQWPIIEHFGTPKRLKGCGFKGALRDSSD
jgi:Fe-S-cluster containining protein